jgi:drug/metabolite transporter (DMT)-like permease
MRLPLGPVIPVAAILVSLGILFGAKPDQLRAGVIALVAGAILFAVTAIARRKP